MYNTIFNFECENKYSPNPTLRDTKFEAIHFLFTVYTNTSICI